MSDDTPRVVVGHRCEICGAGGTLEQVLEHAEEKHNGDGVDDYAERIYKDE